MRLAALTVVLTLALPVDARADDRPVCAEPPSDAEVRRRLAVIDAHVREQEPLVRRWFTSFALVHAVMAAGAAILAAQSERNDGFRVEMTVNTVSSVLALASLSVAPPPLMGTGGSLDAMSEDNPGQRLAKLRVGEDALRRASNAVDFVTSWLPVTGTSVYVFSAATTLLAGFGRLNAAYTHGVGGVIMGLGRLLLRPTGARSAWRRYRRGYPDAACEEPVSSDRQTSFRMMPAGLGFRLTF